MKTLPQPLAQILPLAITAAGAIGVAPATLAPLFHAATPTGIAAALAGFGSAFFANLFSSKSLNTLDALTAQINKSADAGKLPPNHDIERAAQEAYRATLLILAEHLDKSGKLPSYSDKKWLKALCTGLKKANPKIEPPMPPPAPWPNFSLASNAPADALEKLWRNEDGVFEDELHEKTKTWFRAFADETQTLIPDAASAAIEHGWENPSIANARHTLSSVWSECFRYEIKHSPPAATAHLFGTLACLIEGQREILSRLPAAGTPSGAVAATALAGAPAPESAIVQEQLAAISQKLDTRDQQVLDELAQIKQRIPIPANLEKSLDNMGKDIRVLTKLVPIGFAVVIALLLVVIAGRVIFKPSDKNAEDRAIFTEVTGVCDWATKEDATRGKPRSREEVQDYAMQVVAKNRNKPVQAIQTSMKRYLAAPSEDALEDARKKLYQGKPQEARADAMAFKENLLKEKQQRDADMIKKLFEAQKVIGRSLYDEGKFEEAIATYRQTPNLIAANFSTKLPDTDCAELQNLQGNAWSEWANRSEGAAVAQRRQQAVSAYRSALEVYTRNNFPQQWATIQNNLAVALDDQASVSQPSERAPLLAQAVSAFHSALEVRTRNDFPQDWAETQNNLAIALRNQADASEGAECVRLLGELVDAYRAILDVYTRKDFPQRWAITQNNLGAALRDQADASDGLKRARLLGESVATFRSALEVRTRKDFPQDWALTQYNLGIVLRDQASASDGSERASLLGESVAALRAALEVRTRKDFPQGWAMTQNILAATLCDQASASDGPERARLLGESVAAYRAALEVMTRKDFPQDWAMIQNNLAAALDDQASASDGPERASLLDESVAAYRAALEVRTRKDFPQGWAMTQYNLAKTLVDQAEANQNPTRTELLKAAIGCYEAALEVRTKKDLPSAYEDTQHNLSITRRLLAEAEAGTPH